MVLEGLTESKDAYLEHEGGWRGRCYSRSVCTQVQELRHGPLCQSTSFVNCQSTKRSPMGLKIFVGRYESRNTKARESQFRAVLTQGGGRRTPTSRRPIRTTSS